MKRSQKRSLRVVVTMGEDNPYLRRPLEDPRRINSYLWTGGRRDRRFYRLGPLSWLSAGRMIPGTHPPDLRLPTRCKRQQRPQVTVVLQPRLTLSHGPLTQLLPVSGSPLQETAETQVTVVLQPRLTLSHGHLLNSFLSQAPRFKRQQRPLLLSCSRD